MQKVFIYIIILVGLILACEPYEDFKADNDFTSVYFPFQQPVRQLVVGEGLKFNIGVVMGGRRDNFQDETVIIQVDETLLEGTPMKMLPASYYTLSTASEVIIPQGRFNGLIQVTLDSALFVQDDSSYFQHYAIPMRILSSSVDTVLEEKDYTIFGLRAFNQYHAVYYHTGRSLATDSTGKVVDETVFTRPVFSNNAIWKVYSSSYNSVTTDGIDRYLTNDKDFYRMRLTVNNSNVTVTSDTSSIFSITDLGGGKYDDTKRSFTLNYSFTDTLSIAFDTINYPDSVIVLPVTKTVNDTLLFRNVPLRFEEWEVAEEEQ